MRSGLYRNVRRIARRCGFEVVRLSPVNNESLLGLHLAKLFPKLGIDCVLDVGGRVGEYGTWLRNNGYTGKIVSFEPVSESFARLKKVQTRDPAWTAHKLALGSKNEYININVAYSTNFSSFLAPNEYSLQEFGEQPSVARTELVEVRRLEDVWDALVSAIGVSRVFLKMDTQGWDLEVLAGAGSSLAFVPAFQSEISIQPIYQAMPSYEASISQFARLGYALSGLFPVQLDSSMRVIEFDCVAVRTY